MMTGFSEHQLKGGCKDSHLDLESNIHLRSDFRSRASGGIAATEPGTQILAPVLCSSAIGRLLVYNDRHVVGTVSHRQDSSSRQHRSMSRVTG